MYKSRAILLLDPFLAKILMSSLKLSYGLNVPKKAIPISKRLPPAKRKTIFDDDSGPEDGANEANVEDITTFEDTRGVIPETSFKSKLKSDKEPARKPPQLDQQGDLAASHTARKHAAEAQSLDSTVFEYDEVYDLLHNKPKKSTASTGPKYMSSLLAAAEVRKRDELRAKDTMLAREREAEGEEFADKEKFVTGAYKAQQQEVRRLEEEERKKEEKEAEKKRRMGGGMTELYKDILAREEERHDEAVRAIQKGRTADFKSSKEIKEKSEAELARETGAAVNDDGLVIDKRELLKAGLNVKAKPKPTSSNRVSAGKPEHSDSMAILSGRNSSKAAMRERQSRMLETQLEEAAKRAADDEDVEKEAQQRAAKSKKTSGEINSARDRYLQRKREAEAAKTAGREP